MVAIDLTVSRRRRQATIIKVSNKVKVQALLKGQFSLQKQETMQAGIKITAVLTGSAIDASIKIDGFGNKTTAGYYGR